MRFNLSRSPGLRPFLVPVLLAMLAGGFAERTSRAQTATPAGGSTGTAATPELPSLVITSEPTGAVVTLLGPYEWVGQTPWQLYREVTGVYRIEARLPGYEPFHDEVVLGAGGVRELKLHLSRRTRLKAAGRSLLVPGWGQFYTGSKTKGALMTVAAIGAAGGLAWTHVLYQDEVDTFDARRDAYERSTRQEDLPALRAAVQKASDDADRAYDRRQILLGATVAVWAVSVVDAMFFFPSGEASPSSVALVEPDRDLQQGLGWMAQMEPGTGARAGLTYRWK